MLVEDVMRRDVVTASPKTTLPAALALVQRRGIRHLPVVEDGSLAEVVHAIEDATAVISSVVTLPGRAGRTEVVVRVKTINPGPAIRRLEARGYTVRTPWRG